MIVARVHAAVGKCCSPQPSRALTPLSTAAFSILELLVVIAIIATLSALLIPLVGMLRQSARSDQANRAVAQLHLALTTYMNEDPQHRLPPAEAEGWIRAARGSAPARTMNLLEAMGQTSNLPQLIDDPADGNLKVLVDPWGRPYRYQPDVITQGGDPTLSAVTVRPDPTRSDWNGHNHVPYDYVWSLGRPHLGHFGQLQDDPDAVAPNPAWIYVHTTATGP